jgi:hypothetical protein
VPIDWQAASLVLGVGPVSGEAGGMLPVSLEAALAPGVEFATVSLSVDGEVVRRGVAPTGRVLLDPGPYADGRTHLLAAQLETSAGVTASDRVRFSFDPRPLAAYGAASVLAWTPLAAAPGRLTRVGYAADLAPADPGGERGGVVSPPVWLDFSRAPVLVIDGLVTGDRWALAARFPRSPEAGTLVLVAPTRDLATVEIDLRRAIDAAARKALVAAPTGADGLVPVELVLETVGKGSSLRFYPDRLDLTYSRAGGR